MVTHIETITQPVRYIQILLFGRITLLLIYSHTELTRTPPIRHFGRHWAWMSLYAKRIGKKTLTELGETGAFSNQVHPCLWQAPPATAAKVAATAAAARVPSRLHSCRWSSRHIRLRI